MRSLLKTQKKGEKSLATQPFLLHAWLPCHAAGSLHLSSNYNSTNEKELVVEQPNSGESHRHVVLIARRDDLVIRHGPARLCHVGYPHLQRTHRWVAGVER